MAKTQWVIQFEGRWNGPFTSDQILKEITEGKYTGGELIRAHPDGNWQPLAQVPEFYDSLLEALERTRLIKQANRNPKHGSAPGERAKLKVVEDEEETVAGPAVPSPIKPRENNGKKSKRKENQTNPSASNNSPPDVAKDHPPFESQSRDLAPWNSNSPAMGALPPQMPVGPGGLPSGAPAPLPPSAMEKLRAALPAILLFVGALGVAIYLLLEDPTSTNSNLDTPNLIPLARATADSALSPGEVINLNNRINSNFVVSTFESLWESQKDLIRLSQAQSSNIEARGLLCLTYLRLWPLVRQDTKDLATVQNVTRQTKSLDPVGVQGLLCELANLMVQGKFPDARGLVDFALTQPRMDRHAPLYVIKAELLEAERDYPNAFLFAKQATDLWPDWVFALGLAAELASRTQKTEEAQSYYQRALSLWKNHRQLALNYGSFLILQLKQYDEGTKVLEGALSSKGRVGRLEEARGFFALATALNAKQLQDQALRAAARAFTLNPVDSRIRELVIALGGSTERNQKQMATQHNELVHTGDQYFRSGDYLSAQAEYAAAFEMQPKNSVAARKAGEALWRLGQEQEAISWLRRAVKADPKYPLPYVLLADYLSERFEFQLATDALNQGMAKIPGSFELLRGHGLVQQRRNNCPEAIRFLDQALKISPTDVPSLNLLAECYLAGGETQKGIQSALAASELDATDTHSRIVYAKLLAQSKGTDSAVQFMRELLQRYARTVEYRLGLAEILAIGERFNESRELYQQIFLANPRNKKAAMGLAKSLHALGRFEDAIRTYLQAAVLDPSDAQPLIQAGMVFFETGNYKEAIRQFERGLRLNANYPLANFYIGKAAYELQDYDRALAAADQERKINPSLADPYVLSGEIHFATRNYKSCAEQLQLATQRQPKGGELYVRLARCHLAMGNLDIAESMLAIAASQESGLADVYREQGIVFERKKDVQAAIQAYNRYLILAPNAKDRQQVEEKVQALGGSR